MIAYWNLLVFLSCDSLYLKDRPGQTSSNAIDIERGD